MVSTTREIIWRTLTSRRGVPRGAREGFRSGEGLVVGIGREVAALAPPAGDGVDHPGDHLADAHLPPRCPQGAAEVLGDHHVGRHLGPEGGDLAVLLLEDQLPFLVGDAGGALLPAHLVVGVDSGLGEAAFDPQAAGAHLQLSVAVAAGAAPALTAHRGRSSGWVRRRWGSGSAHCLVLFAELSGAAMEPTSTRK